MRDVMYNSKNSDEEGSLKTLIGADIVVWLVIATCLICGSLTRIHQD